MHVLPEQRLHVLEMIAVLLEQIAAVGVERLARAQLHRGHLALEVGLQSADDAAGPGRGCRPTPST